jgi:hypothetical protein
MNILSWIPHKKPPDELSEKVYDCNRPADLLVDVQSMVARGKDVFIVDPYINLETLTLIIKTQIRNVRIMVSLTNARLKHREVTAFKKQMNDIPVRCRQSDDFHDRVLFIDKKCWVIGSSFKDAAWKKPTYIIPVKEHSKMRQIYENIWARSPDIVVEPNDTTQHNNTSYTALEKTNFVFEPTDADRQRLKDYNV